MGNGSPSSPETLVLIARQLNLVLEDTPNSLKFTPFVISPPIESIADLVYIPPWPWVENVRQSLAMRLAHRTLTTKELAMSAQGYTAETETPPIQKAPRILETSHRGAA